MNTTINSDLIRGNINTIILKALYEGDRYGYDIIKEIEQKSSGQYVLKQPTLYSCLKRLEVQGFIRSYWGAKSNGGRRKYYTLTDMGRELFLKNQSEWEYSRTVIDRLISDREADLADIDRAYLKEQSVSIESQPLEEQELDENAYDSLEEQHDEVAETCTHSVHLVRSSNHAATLQIQAESELTESELSESELAILAENESALNESILEDEPTPDIDKLKELFHKGTVNEEKPERVIIDPVRHEREYTDTSKLLDKLFSQEADESDDDSYAEKLVSDSYEAIPQKKAEESVTTRHNSSVGYESDYQNSDYSGFNRDDDDDSNNYRMPSIFSNSVKNPPAQSLPVQNPPAPPPPEAGFLRYDTKIEHNEDDKSEIIKRDYKNVLGKLVANQSTAVPDAAPVETKPAIIPPTKEMTLAEEATDKLLHPKKEAEPNLPSTEKKYSEITSSFRELGDNICVRGHSTLAAREHESKLYFYPYRLMQRQYAILLIIMFAMIAATFLIVRGAGYTVLSIRDIWIYALAIALAVILPIAAAILNFQNPDKKVRIQYNFQSSLAYRMILLVGCLILVYCINIYLEMPPTLSADYLCPLLLPSLFSLCLPINTIIFNSLFNSGKYSA